MNGQKFAWCARLKCMGNLQMFSTQSQSLQIHNLLRWNSKFFCGISLLGEQGEPESTAN